MKSNLMEKSLRLHSLAGDAANLDAPAANFTNIKLKKGYRWKILALNSMQDLLSTNQKTIIKRLNLLNEFPEIRTFKGFIESLFH